MSISCTFRINNYMTIIVYIIRRKFLALFFLKSFFTIFSHHSFVSFPFTLAFFHLTLYDSLIIHAYIFFFNYIFFMDKLRMEVSRWVQKILQGEKVSFFLFGRIVYQCVPCVLKFFFAT